MITPFLHLRIDENPLPWERTRGEGRRRFNSERFRNWKEAVALYARAAANEQGLDYILTGQLGVVVNFYRADRRGVDIDNLIKGVLDSLQGVIFENDNQIVGVLATLQKGFKSRPGLDMYILPYHSFETIIDPVQAHLLAIED